LTVRWTALLVSTVITVGSVVYAVTTSTAAAPLKNVVKQLENHERLIMRLIDADGHLREVDSGFRQAMRDIERRLGAQEEKLDRILEILMER
jgi:hypothetical protein